MFIFLIWSLSNPRYWSNTKQQLITTVSDLTLRTLTCNNIIVDDMNFNVMLTELETKLDTTAKKNTDNTF